MKKDRLLQLRTDSETLQLWKQWANESGLTLSDAIRYAMLVATAKPLDRQLADDPAENIEGID